jgi:hypothetical protein
MNKREAMQQQMMFDNLARLGIDRQDSEALRRISMTLRRWYELECGDGNEYGSWAIERNDETDEAFMVHHHYTHGKGKDYTTQTKIADKETGAKKRLAKIMAKYPGLTPYIQTDPRGAALYILRPSDMIEGSDISSYYSRGICVY